MTKKQNKTTGRAPAPRRGRGSGPRYSLEERLKAVEQVKAGAKRWAVARALGISAASAGLWVRAFEKKGLEGLKNPKVAVSGPQSRAHRKGKRVVHEEAIKQTKQANPQAGTRRIRDLLRRFEAIGVSEQDVRRVLHEAGLISR